MYNRNKCIINYIAIFIVIINVDSDHCCVIMSSVKEQLPNKCINNNFICDHLKHDFWYFTSITLKNLMLVDYVFSSWSFYLLILSVEDKYYNTLDIKYY